MSKLFESGKINGLELSNRFVRSATWEAMATEEGAVTPQLIETLITLAKGGVGLIFSGHSYVRREGQAGPRQLGVYKDELVDGLKELVAAVHGAGGKIVMQITHAGTFAAENLSGLTPLAVSDYEGLAKTPRREITAELIKELAVDFGKAASRAKQAGFDGVQFHSAHGYLLSQFLSPIFNRRQDEYGGNAANRSRIHLEVYQAIREMVGPDYPVMVKLNAQDYMENGLVLEDSLQTGKMLAEAGIDAIEISGGLLTGGKMGPSRMAINAPDREAYFAEDARAFKKALDIPIMVVGGCRSLEKAESLVESGATDYVSICRPLIREPNLINRWKSGDRRPAECVSDNLCFKPAMKGDPIYCVTRDKKKQ